MNTLDFNNWHILEHQQDNNNKATYNENQDDDLDNGLLPPIWGPPAWRTLHCITFGYPIDPTKEDKVHFKMFFKILGYVLPCKSCRLSYINFIKTGDTKMTDDVFKNRKSLTYWLYKVHEAVNKKIGVTYEITYEDLVETYESFRAKCSTNNKCLAASANKETEAFKNEYKVDCNIIPYNIAKYFKTYGEKRGVSDFNDLDKFKNIKKIKKSYIWDKRNNECYSIIKYMRENGIPSLETEGKFKGLPTVEELKLIARLSSNLHFDEIHNLFEKMDGPPQKYTKKYKFAT